MTNLKESYASLARPRQIALITGAAALVLLTASALWWALTPSEQLLFGDLAQNDAAEVSAALEEWKIPHSFTADGSGILVEQAQVHPVRMRLVSAGIPKGGHVGFELFDSNEFGVTEFAQRINYQRALQGEMERTIAAIPGVQAVRVHLTIRRPGVFLAEDSASKASVAVTMAPGSQLNARQVSGIRNLVASAVDGLAPDSVVVVGPTGLQMGGAVSSEGLVGEQGDAARQLGAQYEQEIRKLLVGVPGGEDAAVSVNVSLNFDKVRSTSERVLLEPGQAQGVVVRRNSNADRAADGSAGGLVNEQVEYAHGTAREEITRSAGRIERLTVAVALRSAMATDQQAHLHTLIEAAVGADAARGDRVEIGVAPSSVQAASREVPSRAVDQMPEASEVGFIPTRTGWFFPAGAMLITAILGVGVGVLVGRRAKSTNSARLTREQSELASQKVRAWLTGPV